MKLTILLISATLAGVLSAFSAQSARTGTTTGGVFSVTNQISNAQYAPVAALLNYTAPVSGTVRVERVSASNTYLLAVRVLTNTQALVWTPDFECAFTNSDVLLLSFPAATGAVQLIFDRLP